MAIDLMANLNWKVKQIRGRRRRTHLLEMRRNDHYDLARCKGYEFVFDQKRSNRDKLKFVLLEVQVR